MTGVTRSAAITFSARSRRPAVRTATPAWRSGGGRGETPARGANLTESRRRRSRRLARASRRRPMDVREPRPAAAGCRVVADAPDTHKIATLQQKLAETQAARWRVRLPSNRRSRRCSRLSSARRFANGWPKPLRIAARVRTTGAGETRWLRGGDGGNGSQKRSNGKRRNRKEIGFPFSPLLRCSVLKSGTSIYLLGLEAAEGPAC